MTPDDPSRLRHWQEGLAGSPPQRRQVEMELYREVEGAVLRLRTAAFTQGLAFEHDVRQLTHDLMLSLLEPLQQGHFETLAQLHGWLRTAVPRRSLNLWRERRTFKARTFSTAVSLEPTLERPGPAPDPEPQHGETSALPPDTLVAGTLYVERFQEEVRRLTTPEEWRIWRLHVEDGLGPSEIDRQLGKAPGTASTRLSQLRNGKLQTLLTRLRQGEDLPKGEDRP